MISCHDFFGCMIFNANYKFIEVTIISFVNLLRLIFEEKAVHF